MTDAQPTKPVDTRPKPTRQQRKFFLGLSRRLSELYDEHGEYFWKERPWLEDKTQPVSIIEKPEWEEEKALLQKKINKTHDELDRLFKEMYPPDIYPELHGATEQQALIEGVAPVLHNVPKAEPKTVENMSMSELEEVFGGRKNPPEIVAKTTAGAEILKQFEQQRNRRRGY